MTNMRHATNYYLFLCRGKMKFVILKLFEILTNNEFFYRFPSVYRRGNAARVALFVRTASKCRDWIFDNDLRQSVSSCV